MDKSGQNSRNASTQALPREAELLVEQLRAELERCQRAAKVGTFVYDPMTETWTGSSVLDELLGIDATHPRTRAGALASISAVWRERVQKLVAELSSELATPIPDFEITRPGDGASRWVRVTVKLVQRKGRSLIVGTLQDVDEQVRCDAIRQAILEATDEGVLVVSSQGVIRQYNHRFVELWGIQEQELATHTVQTLVEFGANQVEDPASFVARAQSVIANQQRTSDLLRLKDGRVFERFAAPLPLHGQDPECLLLFRDVTPQAQASTRLAQRESLLRECQHAAHIGSWELDLATKELNWTEECYRICGVSPETCSPSLEWLHQTVLPEDVRVLDEHFTRVMTTLDFEPFEYRIKTPAGKVRWVHVEGAVECDTQAQPKRLYGTQQDVTERKENELTRLDLERRFLHSQKAESLGVLAGGIAHDFNNLLMAILGNLDLALPSLPEGHPAIEDLEQAMIAARKASGLTRQMLAYSGRSKFAVEPIDLGQLVRQDLALFRASASKLVELDVRIEPELALVLVDRGQMQQVVMNLVTNASEAIGEAPGVITLSLGTRAVDSQELARSRLNETPPPGSYVFLRVEDTGCGMSQETQERLFDPFFTTKRAGRGLGMSAILGVVRAHHGAIFVRSHEGDGSCIEVLLAASRTAVTKLPSQPPVSLTSSSRATKRILLVDDEDAVRRVCEQMLKRLGWSVLSAAGGAQALEIFKAQAEEIACVVLDWSMPQMNGLELFRAIRKMKPDTVAILSSGYAWNQDGSSELCDQGIAGFIQKPYELAALERELRRVLVTRET